MKKTSFLAICLLLLTALLSNAQPHKCCQQGNESLWPKPSAEAKPYARWWWLGSAVDKQNLDYLLDEYSKAGMGGLEITPIYGVQGNDKNDIQFLSPKWMEMLKFLQQKGEQTGIKIDMNTGTGWPFGGPTVTEQDAAKRFELDKDGNITTALTKQKVKRAAPGGEGFVMDHFDKGAVTRYLDRFTKAFKENGVPYPHNFFNDSYEVYGASWTPTLVEEFQKRKGYDISLYKQLLQERLGKKDDKKDAQANKAAKAPKLSPADAARIISDYREVLGELLLENFTQTWTAWAHEHGTVTRNQAHGSPGNLIDIYAAVDIPECEGFGLSNFGIKGLRQDSLTRPNYSDLSMLKYASSAAHISGKNLTSSETFTWLTEHFRTSLSQCKPELDLFFVAGVNHVYFHGTCYSPKEAAWPGWKFYASVDMSPTNTIWRDAPAMFDYITRCQSFLQMGKPDNELLVYLPIYDMWNDNDGGLLLFDIHKMDRLAPDFIKTIHSLNDAGYDCDYISDKFLRQLSLTADGQLQTESGVLYKALIIPNAKLMPVETVEKLLSLAQQGAKIVFLGGYPTDVPGYNDLKARRAAFKKILKQLPKYGLSDIASTGVIAEEMKSVHGLHAIRRTNCSGHHYFLSSLQDKGVDAWVNLSVQAESALIFDPMTGDVRQALLRKKDGRTQVYLKLASGESCILRTFKEKTQFDRVPLFRNYEAKSPAISLSKGKCSLDINGQTYQLDKLKPWTELGIAALDSLAGTGTYHININIDNVAKANEWQLDLGDVRESAKVFVNGSLVGTLWAVPFTMNIGKYLRNGENQIDIEVTNLPANRIAALDKRGVNWRIFKEINIVDRNYKKTGYGHWPVSESGLNSEPKLVPLTQK